MIEGLEKLITLHKSLNEIAKRKTKIIINGQIDPLQSILKEESRHTHAIHKFNNTVLKIGSELLGKDDFPIENLTLSNVINNSKKEDRVILTHLQQELQEQVEELNQQNKLNQELLDQSLQLINVSLDLLTPDMESINYNPSTQNEQKEAYSIFDSKA